MAQTSIHIRPVQPTSEKHNNRTKHLDYVRPDLTRKNEKSLNPNYGSISDTLAKIKDDYLAAKGKKLSKMATPIREAVIVIEDKTEMQQIKDFCRSCKEKWGIDAMQIYTHRDEGHFDADKVWHTNNHGHIVFNWYNFETHSTIKLKRQDMVEMQTMLAQCLKMERGVKSSKKWLNALQQKNNSEQMRLDKITSELDAEQAKLNQTAEQARELAQKIAENDKALQALILNKDSLATQISQTKKKLKIIELPDGKFNLQRPDGKMVFEINMTKMKESEGWCSFMLEINGTRYCNAVNLETHTMISEYSHPYVGLMRNGWIKVQANARDGVENQGLYNYFDQFGSPLLKEWVRSATSFENGFAVIEDIYGVLRQIDTEGQSTVIAIRNGIGELEYVKDKKDIQTQTQIRQNHP